VFIKSKNKTPIVRGVILAVLLTLMAASPAAAARFEVCLAANSFVDAATGVTMWGYGDYDCTDRGNNAVEAAVAVSVPGPRISVPVGDWLQVRLVNLLPVQTSFGIAGMVKRNRTATNDPMAPVFFTDPQGRARISSLDDVANAGGGRMDYRFRKVESNTGDEQPGTYLYGSVTHQQVQRQMGLYGALTQNFAAGEAYPGVLFQAEEVLVYSEVDSALHAQVVADAADNGVVDGSAGGYTSTVDYNPDFFLLNGAHRPYAASGSAGVLDIPADANQNVLLRILNAGLRTIMPNILGQQCSVVAQDGSPYPFPRDQHSVEVWAGTTRDCIVNSPVDGTFPIIERRTTGLNGDGGQMAFLVVGPPPVGPPAPVVADDAYGPIFEDAGLGAFASVLGNDDPGLTAFLVSPAGNGTVALAGDGTFDYTPNANFNGVDSFTYQATNGSQNSNVATVTIPVTAVNDAPVAVADAYTVPSGQLTNIPATGVLANDSDIDGDAITAVLGTTTAGGLLALSSDGSFDYTPNAGTTVDSFTYTASDSLLSSALTTVTITVEANIPPLAVADAYAVPAGTTTNTPVPGVLGNDSDGDGDALTAVLGATTAGGTLVLNSDGSFDYTPNAGTTVDSFTYSANDGKENGNTVTVDLTILSNPPVAGDNSAFAARTRRGVIPGNRNTCVPAFIDLLADDAPGGAAIDPASVAIVTSPGSGGMVTVNAAGVATYTGAVNFRGTETFTYTVDDTAGNTSNVAKVTVNVVGQRSFKRKVGLSASGKCVGPTPTQ